MQKVGPDGVPATLKSLTMVQCEFGSEIFMHEEMLCERVVLALELFEVLLELVEFVLELPVLLPEFVVFEPESFTLELFAPKSPNPRMTQFIIVLLKLLFEMASAVELDGPSMTPPWQFITLS